MFTSQAHAAIGFDASTTVVDGTTATTTITVGNNTNRILVIAMANALSSATGTTVTVNGNAATLITSAVGGTQNRSCQLFYYLNPPTGSNSVSSTNPNLSTGIFVASYYGVNQSTPIDTTASSSVSSPNAFVTSTITTTVANDWLVDGVTRAALGSIGSSQTLVVYTSGSLTAGTYYPTTAATAYNITYHFSTTELYVDCAAALEPASTAASVPTTADVTFSSGVKVSSGVTIQ